MQGLLKTNLIGLGGKCLYDVVVRYQARNVLSGNNTLLATYCSILCMGCMHHTIRMYQYCVAGKKKCLFFYLFFIIQAVLIHYLFSSTVVFNTYVVASLELASILDFNRVCKN